MTDEERWQRAFDDEAREPSDWEPDVAALERRLRVHLAKSGCAWPEIAASVIAARAFGHLDRAAFASRLGVAERDLRTLEGAGDHHEAGPHE
jgi:hypothetical protein